MAHTIKDLKHDVAGKDIYLIGGGTSFNPDEYVSILPPSQVICLNSALKDFESCLAVMWMDSSWMGNNTDLLREGRHKYGIQFNIDRQHLDSTGRGHMIIRNVSCSACDYSVPREPYNVCGNNTGACAIDLLDQLQAKTIYLLGFDCKEENGKSNYHSRYKTYVKQHIYNKNFIPCFDRLSKHVKHSRVVNVSKGSLIDSFPRATLNNLKPDS